MNFRNRYFAIAAFGAAATLLLQIILMFTIDTYVATVLSPFYSVWIIIFVIGWRKEHSRR